MYYIFKFSDSWMFYDTVRQISRPLDKTEIDCLRNLLSGLLADNKILQAIEVNSVQPNKLAKLSLIDKNATIKKTQENSTKAN